MKRKILFNIDKTFWHILAKLQKINPRDIYFVKSKKNEMTSNLPPTSIFLTKMSGFRENHATDFVKFC